jgi:long-chain acyl-CoA synthetase
MLYERWREVAREFQNETALVDCLQDRRWTFGQLASQTDHPNTDEPPVSFPQGLTAEFIFQTLRAWRAGKIVCPIEPGSQIAPVRTFPPGCAHLKITSASTGVPRTVAFTADQLAADVANIISTMGLRREWPNVGAISLAHSYGFSNLVLPLLLHGLPLVLAGSPLPAMLRRAASHFPEITLAAVPALWRTWFECRALPENIRLAISAGAPLPLELEQTVYRHCGVKIHNFYGASECGGIAYDASNTPRQDASYVGSPLDNVEITINPEGCLRVRSAAVGLAYLPEASPFGGLFQTGDLAQLIGGSVHLHGRHSEQINVAGRKVSPSDIEAVLTRHPEVRACLVFGAPNRDHPDRAEMIVACVAVRTEIAADVLRRYLLEKLPAWQTPRAWWIVDELPANERGKVSRAEWRRRYLERAKPDEA